MRASPYEERAAARRSGSAALGPLDRAVAKGLNHQCLPGRGQQERPPHGRWSDHRKQEGNDEEQPGYGAFRST